MALLLIGWINLSAGLYFHISETEHKCFLEEVPAETMIVGNYYNGIFIKNSLARFFLLRPIGKYKIQLFDHNRNEWLPSSPGIGVHVEVTHPLYHTY